MTQAARMGDMTAHGTPLSPGTGSTNVLICGMPAWRANVDFHSCPLPNPAIGAPPHTGGNTVPSCLTVLINGQPAARVGDTIIEVGPPNSIIIGCPTVLIG